MKSRETFERLTARTLGTRGLEWVDLMVERWGEDRVAAALEETARHGNLAKLLHRTSDRLAAGDATRARPAPPEIPAQTLLAAARGEIPEPSRPYIYDLRDLTREEYSEVMEWKAGR